MSSFPDDLRELYFEFGRAAEMAQVMETEAGNLALVYVSMFVDTSKITDEQREFFRVGCSSRKRKHLWQGVSGDPETR